MTIKANGEYLQFAVVYPVLTYGWHLGGAGNKTVTIGPKWRFRATANRVSNIRRRDRHRISLLMSRTRGGARFGDGSGEKVDPASALVPSKHVDIPGLGSL